MQIFCYLIISIAYYVNDIVLGAEKAKFCLYGACGIVGDIWSIMYNIIYTHYV